MTETETRLAASQNLSEQSEADLIAQARRDPQAFGALYRLYVQQVFRYLYSRIGSRAEAEDATAQTFLAVMDGLERYRHKGYFAAWLFSIARRKAADHFRGQRGQVPLEAVQEIPVEADYLQDAIRTERIAALREQVSALPEKERDLLRLRYVAELPFSEISRLLGRNEAAVKKALYRLLARLHSQLEEKND
jgi:RNA polymerase sigma-70 factor (ECF subfamily)